MSSVEDHTRTGHLNQVRGYLLDSDYAGTKVGALLYPMVNTELQKGKVHPIMDTPIIIKTINLNADWRDVEKDMLDFVHRIELAKNKHSTQNRLAKTLVGFGLPINRHSSVTAWVLFYFPKEVVHMQQLIAIRQVGWAELLSVHFLV